MKNIIDISIFLERFKDFSKRLERQKVVHFKTKYDGLFNGFESLNSILNRFNEKEASKYNVFEILNISTAEVKTHTPFLCNLLDPNGSHGQKELFLSSFINNFVPAEKRSSFVLNDKRDYVLEQEKNIHKGRIDIYLQSIQPDKKFEFIIENKLLASDQEFQLKRYYEFAKKKEYNDSQIMIYYLTIDGAYPSEYSIDKALMTDLTKRKVLYNLSYKTDIKAWLVGLTKEIKADNVRLQIEQYIATIEKF